MQFNHHKANEKEFVGLGIWLHLQFRSALCTCSWDQFFVKLHMKHGINVSKASDICTLLYIWSTQTWSPPKKSDAFRPPIKIKPNSKTIFVRPSLGSQSDLWILRSWHNSIYAVIPPTEVSLGLQYQYRNKLKTALVLNTSVPSPSSLALFLPLLKSTSSALFLLPLWHSTKVATPHLLIQQALTL